MGADPGNIPMVDLKPLYIPRGLDTQTVALDSDNNTCTTRILV